MTLKEDWLALLDSEMSASMAFRVLGAAGLVLGLHILRRVASGRAAAPKPLGEGETEPLLEGEASSPKAAPQPAGDVGEANLERSPSLEEAAVAGAAGVAAAGAAAAAAANADNGGEAHDADSGAAPAAAEAAQQGGSGATAGAAASGAEVLPTGQAAAGEARALSEAMDKQQLASALDAEQRQEALAGSSTEAEGLAVAEELAEPIAASVAAEAEAPAAKEAQEGDSAWDRSQPSSAAEQPPLAATRAGDDPAEPEAAAQAPGTASGSGRNAAAVAAAATAERYRAATGLATVPEDWPTPDSPLTPTAHKPATAAAEGAAGALGPEGGDGAAAESPVLPPSGDPSRDSDVSLADGLGGETSPPGPQAMALGAQGPQSSASSDEAVTLGTYRASMEDSVATLPSFNSAGSSGTAPAFPSFGSAGSSSAGAAVSAFGSAAGGAGAGSSAGALQSPLFDSAGFHSWPSVGPSISAAADTLPALRLGGGVGGDAGAQAAAARALARPASFGPMPMESEPSLRLGMALPNHRGSAAEAALPPPARLSLSDWVPPVFQSSSGAVADAEAAPSEAEAAVGPLPLPLGSPLIGGPLPSPPPSLSLPAWAGANPPTSGLSAAAALERESPRDQQPEYAPPEFTLDSPARLALGGAGAGAFGAMRLDGFAGPTRRSLLPDVFQPGSPLLEQGQGGGSSSGTGAGGLSQQLSPRAGGEGHPAGGPPPSTFSAQHANDVAAAQGGFAASRSPFHSPRFGAAGGSSGEAFGGPPRLDFGTHLAERPASPSGEGPSLSRSSSGGGGSSRRRGGGGGQSNPFAWGTAQQAEAAAAAQGQGQGQGQAPSWAEFGVGPGAQRQQDSGEGSSGYWSAAEERLISGNRTPGSSEKRLRVNEFGAQWSAPPGIDHDQPRLALKLLVIAGPCAEAGTSYVTGESTTEVVIGRSPGCTMQLNDAEVSGRHLSIHWNPSDKCWQVADLGSLNGTLLNGEPISQARKRGRDYRLSSDDILQLGTYTKVKVSTFPREMLDTSDRHGSLPVGSLPKSLSVPKHRIPSFTSLLSPKINTTPSKKAKVAAASDELRLECCIISRAGRDHMRKGQVSEDVASAACPLPGGEDLPEGSFPSLFCVFDGHCGRAAAEEANTLLPDEVAARLAGHSEQLSKAQGVAAELRAAFLATDDRLVAEEGSTATAVLAWRDAEGAVCLQAANVGDSAALFIDCTTGSWTAITEDHRLTNPRERERLQKMGIQVTNDTRRLYGLNLARGLGDKFLKDEDLGLSAEPFVSHVLRVPHGEGGLLLIASDGLWDFADAETVTQLVVAADRDNDGNVLEVAAAVIGHAVKQRTRDDVTVLVARIWPEEEWELRSPMKNLDDGASVSFSMT